MAVKVIKWVVDDIYRLKLWIVVDKEPKSAAERIDEFASCMKENPDRANGPAFCMSNADGDFGLFFKLDGLTFCSTYHESRHCVDFMLDYIGHEPDVVDEPAAYLTGFVGEVMHSKFQEGGFRVRLESKK